MPEKHLFEYAIIRVVPRIEREEFINVGVILYCAGRKFLQAAVSLNESRLLALYHEIEADFVLENLNALVAICEGDGKAGPISKLDQPSRFRWLTATRSTVIQTSKVHPGFCKDPQETLIRLMQESVG